MGAETWKPCCGFEGFIEVSDLGRFRSLDRIITTKNGERNMTGIIRKPANDKDGYQLATISINGVHTTNRLHRLIMKTFNPVKNCDNLEVNHIDGDKTNNRLENLEWVTRKENIAHAYKTKLMPERPINKINKKCLICDISYKTYKNKSKYCSTKCSYLSRQTKIRPDKNELFMLLKNNSFVAVGKMFGVSDNAIRKWCKSLNLPTKAKFYKTVSLSDTCLEDVHKKCLSLKNY